MNAVDLALADPPGFVAEVPSANRVGSLPPPIVIVAPGQTDEPQARTALEPSESGGVAPHIISEGLLPPGRSNLQEWLNKLQSIFGTDDRRKVADASQEPWSGICFVQVLPKRGDPRIGTAFLVSRSWAVTAGHVLWDSALGEDGKPARIDVQCGRNGAPVPSVEADYVLSQDYTGEGDVDDDVGLIRLRRPVEPGRYVYSLYAAPDGILESKAGAGFNLAGYPDDKDMSLYRSVGHMARVMPKRLEHQLDTCPGQSGGPVFYKSKVRVVVAVHAAGVWGACQASSATDYNQAVRITVPLADWIKQKAAQYP